jgi:hypothetical protein
LRDHPPQLRVAILRSGNPFQRVAAADNIAARRAAARSSVGLQTLRVVDDGGVEERLAVATKLFVRSRAA